MSASERKCKWCKKPVPDGETKTMRYKTVEKQGISITTYVTKDDDVYCNRAECVEDWLEKVNVRSLNPIMRAGRLEGKF